MRRGEQLWIDNLQDVVPVPESPIDVDVTRLGDTEAALGTQFPSDYLAYARKYGSGTIFIEDVYDWEIYSPFRYSFAQFVRNFFDRQDGYRNSTENSELQLGLYPEPGGLLPFGRRDDVYFTWKTLGDPDEWDIVVIWLYQEGGYELFEMGFCEFMFKLLTKEITVEPYDSDWNSQDVCFESEVFGA